MFIKIAGTLQVQLVQSHSTYQLLRQLGNRLSLNQHSHIQGQRLCSSTYKICDGGSDAVCADIHVNFKIFLSSEVFGAKFLSQDDGGGAYTLFNDPTAFGYVGDELEFGVSSFVSFRTIAINKPATYTQSAFYSILPWIFFFSSAASIENIS